MEKVITSKEENLFELSEIPRFLYNKELTESQRSRLAAGRQTELIRDIVVNRNSPPIDAKVTAIKNKEGQLELAYDYAEKQFVMPTKIFGQALTNDQKAKLFEGELISLPYRGSDYFVGLDKELNKITVKSGRQIGIPEQVADYRLTTEDKLNLANGKAMDTRLYATPEGDYFTAKLKFTEDKKGIEFGEIKFVDRENVRELREKYNAPALEKQQAYENALSLAASVVQANSPAQERTAEELQQDNALNLARSVVEGNSVQLETSQSSEPARLDIVSGNIEKQDLSDPALQPYLVDLQLDQVQMKALFDYEELNISSPDATISPEQFAKIPDVIDGIHLDKEGKLQLITSGIDKTDLDGTSYRLTESGFVEKTTLDENTNPKVETLSYRDVKFDLLSNPKAVEARFLKDDPYRGFGESLYNELLDATKHRFESSSDYSPKFFDSASKKEASQMDWVVKNISEFKEEIKNYLNMHSPASVEKISDRFSGTPEGIEARFPKSDPFRGMGEELYGQLKSQSYLDYESTRSRFNQKYSIPDEKKQMEFAFKNIHRYEPYLVNYSSFNNIPFESDYSRKIGITRTEIYEKFVPSQHPNPPALEKAAKDITVIEPVVLESKVQKSVAEITVVDPIHEGRQDSKAGQQQDGSAREQRPIIEYTDVKSNDTGFTIKATEYFVPDNLKGVKLSEKQKDDLSKGEKIYVEGMKIKGQKTNAYVSINENGGGISFDFDRKSKANSGKDIGKKQQKDDLNLGR